MKPIICNGIPNGGTHLLGQVIEGFGHKPIRWPALIYPNVARWAKFGPPVHIKSMKDHHFLMTLFPRHFEENSREPITWKEVEFLLENGGSVYGHIPYRFRYQGSKAIQITIIRDPRNIILSHYRRHAEFFDRLKQDGETEHDCMRRIVQRLIEPVCAEFTPYLADDKYHVFKYEDLTGVNSPQALEKLAILTDYTGPVTADLLNGDKFDYTFTGSPSDWHTIWNNDWETIFAEYGGNELLQRWNYKPWKA